jgi:hypothetical protein
MYYVPTCNKRYHRLEDFVNHVGFSRSWGFPFDIHTSTPFPLLRPSMCRDVWTRVS